MLEGKTPSVTAKKAAIRVGVGAVVIHQARVLLVQRAHPPAQGQWAIPGGKVCPGETLQHAAEREILEETGVQIRALHPIHTFDLIERDDAHALRHHYVIIDLQADYLRGTPRAASDSLDARWVSQQQMSALDVHPETRKLLEKIDAFAPTPSV